MTKPTYQKLGILPNHKVSIVEAPEIYSDLIELPFEIQMSHENLDFVHIFASERMLLEEHLHFYRHRLAKTGMIWVSWPKKSSRMQKDVNEDAIRDVAIPMGLVDNKVCSINETWSALKLVIRVKLR